MLDKQIILLSIRAMAEADPMPSDDVGETTHNLNEKQNVFFY